MIVLSDFIEQVRAVLIQTEGKKPRHEIHNQFINECETLNFSEEDFYKEILKPAAKSVNWDTIDLNNKSSEQKNEEEKEAKTDQRQKALLKQIDYSLQYCINSGVVEPKELSTIFFKAEQYDIDIDKLAQQIQNSFKKYNLNPYPKPNITLPTLRDELSSATWYNKDNYDKFTKSLTNDKKKWIKRLDFIALYKNLLFRLNIVTSLFLIFVIFSLNNNNCLLCDDLYSTHSSLFNWFCLFLLITLIISRLYLTHESKRWNKSPGFISHLSIYIGFSLTFISIFFGLQTDKLAKYDTTKNKNGWFWFYPFNYIDFPLKQIQLNEKHKNLNYGEQLIAIEKPLKSLANNPKLLYLTLIDRTASNNESLNFKKLSQEDKKSMLKFYSDFIEQKKIDTVKFLNTPLRDHLGFCINPYITNTHVGENCLSGIFMFDGKGNNKNITDMTGTKDDFIIEDKYYDSCNAQDIISKKTKKKEITDFTSFFTYTDSVLRKELSTNTSYHDVYLNILSDFYHEADDTDVTSFAEVNKAVYNFSSNKYLKIKQVNLFIFPLKDPTDIKNAEVNKLLKIFQNQFELCNIYRCDTKYSEENGVSIFNQAVFATASDTNLSPIKFYYSADQNAVSTSLCLRLEDTTVKDTLSCQLIDEDIENSNNGNFLFNYSIYPNNPKKSNPNMPVLLNGIHSGDNLRIEFHKRNISENSNSFQLEFYSNYYKSKVIYPVEFCPILPNTTNIFLLILYTVLYTSFFLFTLLPAHFMILKKYNSRNNLDILNVSLISVLLFMLFLIGFLLFADLLFRYSLNWSIYAVILLMSFGVIIIPTYFQYRYYVSKYLFFNNKNLHNLLCKKIGKLLVRENKNFKMDRFSEPINNWTSYK